MTSIWNMNPNDIPILMYHDISDTDSQWCVSPAAFEQQMSFLYQQGFKTITLSQLDMLIKNSKEKKEKYCVITFDDARKGVVTHAFPILKKYNFSAVVFVVPAWIDGKAPEQESYSLFASWEQLSMLSTAGWEIGSHTQTHQSLPKLTKEQLKAELDNANETLKKKLLVNPRHIAYPFGAYNNEVIAEVSYRCTTAVTTRRGFDKTPYEYARQPIFRSTTKDEFTKLLRKPTLSLCMIVKDEEQTLHTCLASVKELADEIIIGDTGSTDKTKQIAQQFTKKVFDIRWNDDFAVARNETLKHATGDWILLLDADEMLAVKDIEKIKEAIHDWQVQGYQMLTRNYTEESSTMGWLPTLELDPQQKKPAGWYPSLKVRLFQRLPHVKFAGEMHEMVDDSIRAVGKIKMLNIPIHHYGTLNKKTAEEKNAAIARTNKKIEANPNDAKAYFELGIQFKEAGNFAEAERAFTQSLAIEEKSVIQRLNLAIVQQKQSKLDAAIENYAEVIKKSQHPDAYFGLGFCWYRKNSMKKAAQYFALALQYNPYFIDAYINLGAILEKLSNFEPAEQLLRKALSLSPTHARAHYNLGVIYEKMQQNEKAIEHYKIAIGSNYSRKNELIKRIEQLQPNELSTVK